MVVAGIDEAGRGPVLGPMVYSIAWCPNAFESDLKREGFTDSKALTPEKREHLFHFLKEEKKKREEDDVDDENQVEEKEKKKSIAVENKKENEEARDYFGYASSVLSARHISAGMLDPNRTSLNEQALESTCKILEEMLSQVPESEIETVFVDTLGDPSRHKEKLKGKFPGLEFVVESKADVTYPVVSAASIVAKVTRDREIRRQCEEMGGQEDLGSGYPSDPATKEWLTKHVDSVFGFPSLVRFSWATVNRLLEDCGASACTWDCDDDEEDKRQQKLFVRKSSALESSGVGRHSFFRSRKLQKVGAW